MFMSRPDLKAIKVLHQQPWAYDEIGYAKIYSSTDKKKDIDFDSAPRQNTQWSREYAMPEGDTEWVTEEYMGADW
jgi:hypothetical protein